VRPGETVSGLALRLRVSQAAVMRAAGISDPRRLQAGQTLRVRGAAPARKSGHAAKAHGKKKAKPRFSHNTFEGRTYADSIVGSAARNRHVLASRSLPTRSQTKALIARTPRRHGVDPRLALAVSYQESGWSQRQVSVANAIGAMQIIPSTGEWASQMVGRRLNLLDPEDNVTAGVVVLRALLRSAANERQAIAGYYQGPAGVQRHGLNAYTKRNVANVLYHKSHL
jgi:soluble lytic murein transglycosylase-like protein